ncbi:MAG: MarR family transcriptional regulator [Phycisphaerae bacterium]|nr:MarR family transcriptional regulator [Phycisphaerae bacterium]
MNGDPRIDLPLPQRDKQHEAIVSFWWTSTMLKKVSRRFFRENYSSEAHFNLLITLARSEEPMTQNELSQKLLVDKSNITGLLDKLEALGQIKRNKVPADRRSYHVTLTKVGQELVEGLDVLYSGMVRQVMSAFTEEECEQFVSLTRKLRISLIEHAT